MTKSNPPRVEPPPFESATLELSIVMPCLDETETVATCVTKARGFLASKGVNGEVIVADNGSTDGSQEAAARAGARIVHVPERGYGAALAAGIAAARGEFVIMGDSDDSYDFTALAPFLERLRAGDDLVMGNRFAGGIAPGAMPPLHRYLGNPLLSFLGRLFFRSACRDFHCGLRGFRKDAIESLDLCTTGMEFASEMVVKATLRGLRVGEVPTALARDGRSTRPKLRTWRDGRSTRPKLRTWRDGWRHLRFLLVYSPRWLFLYPGLALMVAGLAVGGWLLPGPRTVGGVTLDVHTLVYAALAVLVGFQAVTFAMFTRVFAMNERLLPRDPRLDHALQIGTLEVGLLVGGALIVAGAAGSLHAVGVWGGAGFGNLDPVKMLRTVIPAVTACALGFEVVFASFFLSVLALRRR